ncbi:MAG: aldolase, partial [bacterium]
MKVLDWQKVRQQAADTLAWTAAFSASAEAKAYAAWLIRKLAHAAGNGPASIHEVYLARGRGELPTSFTVPAINIRAFAYYFARAIFRAAKRLDAGAVICELSRSEMGYTNQT